MRAASEECTGVWTDRIGARWHDRQALDCGDADSYEDRWYPFFKLLTTYWPQCNYDILLNTETKDFDYPGLVGAAVTTWARDRISAYANSPKR